MRIMNVNAIVFDLDGTLVDTRFNLWMSVNAVRKKRNLDPLPLDIVTSFIGKNAFDLIEKCLQGDLGNATNEMIDAALDAFKNHQSEHRTENMSLFYDVEDILHECKQNKIVCCVVTNKPEKAATEILEHFGILNNFAFVVGVDTLRFAKPDPRVALHAISKMGFKPEEALIIGDSRYDLEMAHEAHVRSIFLESGYGPMGDHFKPGFIAKDMSDVCYSLFGEIE